MILVIGGTGQIGSLVVQGLVERGADVVALGTREPADGAPAGARLVTGDVMDVAFMQKLLGAASTVFVLNPAVPDELARAMLILGLVEDAGIKGLVYLSMMGADLFADASRAAAKLAAERTIARRHLPATILRPNACFQNDLMSKTALKEQHRYPTPLGNVGVTMVDVRDVAEIAAIELLRRERAADPLPMETIEVVGPETFTGHAMASLWSEVVGKSITYTGDDLDDVERRMRTALPAATAYDLKIVFRGMLREGVIGAPGAADRLAEMLGHPLRTYRGFAEAMAATFV